MPRILSVQKVLLRFTILLFPFLARPAQGHNVAEGNLIISEMSGGLQVPITSPSCSGPSKGNYSGFWLDKQDHTGSARGYAPFIDNYYTYPVYRNVVNDPYNCKNDGSGDQTAALQLALNDDGRGGNRYLQGTTNEPAEVFLPSGTYQIQSKLDLRIGTIIVGDPFDPPVIQAASDFSGGTVVNGYDFNPGGAPDSFMTLLKNVIIDTTNIPADRQVIALQWGVAQGCGLTNVQIRMPTGPTQHVGIELDGGSTISLSDTVSPLFHCKASNLAADRRCLLSKLLVANTVSNLLISKSTSKISTSRIATPHFWLPAALLILFKVPPSTLAAMVSTSLLELLLL